MAARKDFKEGQVWRNRQGTLVKIMSITGAVFGPAYPVVGDDGISRTLEGWQVTTKPDAGTYDLVELVQDVDPSIAVSDGAREAGEQHARPEALTLRDQFAPVVVPDEVRKAGEQHRAKEIEATRDSMRLLQSINTRRKCGESFDEFEKRVRQDWEALVSHETGERAVPTEVREADEQRATKRVETSFKNMYGTPGMIERGPDVLTLRDQFAMASVGTAPYTTADEIADYAYRVADAMLEARKEKPDA